MVSFRKYMIAALVAAAALLLAAYDYPVTPDTDKHIVILATSDMHANIWGYSYGSDTESTNSGMARLYTYIEKIREENPTVFLIDGGDEIQGNVMTDSLANKTPDREHPVMAAMNYMGYDAMTLGNHEFDWDIDTMTRILRQAKFPILGANVLRSDGEPLTGQGWTIVSRNGIRLAVIGVCTPDIPIWNGDKEGVAQTTFEAADVAVKRAMEEIGDRADIVMVSAHMGQYPEYDMAGGSDSGERIVEENAGIDILQLAHMHMTVNDVISGVPAVAVRNAGREIARIDLTLDQDNRIKDISTSIVDMQDYEPSEKLRKLPVVKRFHKKAIRYVRNGSGRDSDETAGQGEPVGVATARFQPDNTIKGIPEGRLRDTALMDLILNVQLAYSGADVTAASLFKDTSDLPEGNIYYSDIMNIYGFDNTLVTMKVTGAELKRYMEWAVAGYNRWEPGDSSISFDPDYPAYLLDVFAGVDYDVNLSGPKGERIENVMFRGRPLKDDQVLKLAVSNYRYASVIKPEKLAAGEADWSSSELIRDMIRDYIAANSPISPVTDNNWRITGVDNICSSKR